MSKYDPAYYQANKAAHRARTRRWAKNNPARAREMMRKARYTAKPTRPEPEWCECCGRHAETTLCFDHDHVTGVFRGWICRSCNVAIGALGDDLAGLERAVAYLKRVS